MIPINIINEIYLYIILGLLGGWAITTLLSRVRARSLLNKARFKLSRVEEEVRNRRREIELEKKEELHRIRASFEKETREKSDELHKLSKRLTEREETVDRRLLEMEGKKKEILVEEQRLEKEREKITGLEIKQREELEKIAGISTAEAKRSLLDTIKEEAKEEAAQIIQKVEREAKETANKKARKIIATAIQRCAVDEVAGTVISTLSLPNDEMKGRVIGR
ncbi:DUF3552 domain-containing protein, partial [Candidatus Aerophobetes bacterium]|nr:DUF3552 domain-containing protein [Candidatus Aerophobetes bacterium]